MNEVSGGKPQEMASPGPSAWESPVVVHQPVPIKMQPPAHHSPLVLDHGHSHSPGAVMGLVPQTPHVSGLRTIVMPTVLGVAI